MKYELKTVDNFDANTYPSHWSREYMCKHHVISSYCSVIREGHKVLEIGVGKERRLYEHCISYGADYYGIDICLPSENERPKNIRKESVEHISFADESFDFVIGNQTIEHWEEYGCPIEKGLSECFRVCKTGGKVLMNFPLYLHGSKDFVFGNMDAIIEYFTPFVSKIDIRSYENTNTVPFNPTYYLRNYKPLSDKKAFVCDIQAIKREGCPYYKKSYLFKNRIIRTILGMPLLYTSFLIKRKLSIIMGMVPKNSTPH